MTPILLDFARKSGFTLCKEESALREMLEQFAKFIIEHEALKQPDYELIAWATTVGSHAHVSWGKDRPDYPIRYEVPLYTTPPAQEFVCSTGLCHYKATSEKRECMNCAAFGECNPNNDTGRCGYEPPAAQRQWVGLMRGVRVDGDSVIVSTKSNDAARQLCGELLRELNGGQA